MTGIIYLLHFDRPISTHHTCQHYMGWTDNLEARLTAHRNGRGARLTAVAHQRSIPFQLVRTWEGDRLRERQLKNWKNGKRLCPFCQRTQA